MMEIYGDMTKILHSLLDLGERHSLPHSPKPFHFPFRLGNISQACWAATACGYDSFGNWITLQRDFKWEESHYMKENRKIKCSQDSWIYYDESHRACIWKAKFSQQISHLPHRLHSPSFILKTKHRHSPALISFRCSLSLFTSSPTEVNKVGGRVQSRENVLL